MAAGLEQPRMIFAHGMWLGFDGRRMSKTLGNAVDLDVLRRHFANDVIRYFCLREMVFGQDGRFGYEAVIDRANNDLAKGLGNLSSRTLTMIQRYCNGAIPSPHIAEENFLAAKRAGVDPDAMGLVSALEHARAQFILHFDDLAFSRGLEAVWSIIARVDKLLSDARPWDLARDENQRQTLNAVLYRAAETLRWLAVMLYPVLPDAARSIWAQLGLAGDVAAVDPAGLSWGGLVEGTSIGAIAPIFPRIDKTQTMREIEKGAGQESPHATQAGAMPSAAAAETGPAPQVASVTEADASAPAGPIGLIDIEDFKKIDLRAGQVLAAERVPKSDKLLRLMVDLGEAEPRQILAGIAEYYEPEKLVGRKIVVVANLKPRRLRGLESQGMVLAASIGEEGQPVLATFTEDVPNGARLK
jgi:methionyl-tRNA synthetase